MVLPTHSDDTWSSFKGKAAVRSLTTKQASCSSTDQGGGKRRGEVIELDQCPARWALQPLSGDCARTQ
jgi:hypothetical protein